MAHDAFALLRDVEIAEIASVARLYRHERTGAEFLSLLSDDDNKVFGVTFVTPPPDSTGMPHILEHSVLGGSRRYPLKEPFVELLKGSLQTFLNAMTFPERISSPRFRTALRASSRGASRPAPRSRPSPCRRAATTS